MAGEVLGYAGSDAKNKGPVCTITSGLNYPVGTSVDAKGNLYVVNQNNSEISVYKPGCGAETATVSDPYGEARDIALNGSTWYVENIRETSNGKGNIAVCSASGCSRELTGPSPGISELVGIAVDAHGNVYGAGTLQGSSYPQELWEWRHGKMPGRIVDSNVPFFGAMEFDEKGNLVVNAGSTLYVVSGCPSACKPHGPFTLMGAPEFFKLNKRNKQLFVADACFGSGSCVGSIDIYSYQGTAGVSYKRSISTGFGTADEIPVGVAVFPPATP